MTSHIIRDQAGNPVLETDDIEEFLEAWSDREEDYSWDGIVDPELLERSQAAAELQQLALQQFADDDVDNDVAQATWDQAAEIAPDPADYDKPAEEYDPERGHPAWREAQES